MVTSKPKVSVVMAAYNAEQYIDVAIGSILNQTFKDLELIVVEDCSTDSTKEIILRWAQEDARVVLAANDANMKISASLNKGLALARSQYIARMDADDEAMLTRIEKQYQFLEKNPDTVLVGASINVCDSSLQTLNVRKYNTSDSQIRKSIFRYGQFCHPAVMFRKEAQLSAGEYNTDLYDVEDYDLFFRLGRQGKMANLDEVLLNYRTSKTSVSALRARRQELLTIYVRLKASAEYGYRMRLSDILYSLLQLVSVFLIPARLKFWIFNFLRRG